VDSIWREALTRLGDLTADFASHAHSVAISAPNRLAIRFLERYNSSKTYCERPERREKLEKAVSDIVGVPIRLEFLTMAIDESHPTPPCPVMSAQQIRQRLASHPMVECAVQLFQAQIAKVETDNHCRTPVASTAELEE
jgi:hypothetical protein